MADVYFRDRDAMYDFVYRMNQLGEHFQLRPDLNIVDINGKTLWAVVYIGSRV